MRRYRVTIDGRTYEVEIDDPRARPVTVQVSGEVFLVDVEPGRPSSVDRRQSTVVSRPSSAESTIVTRSAAASAATGQRALMAPMPGTIVSVAASAGRSVQRGDELVTIEAMKMFNVIRSPWAGIVAEVHVTEGKRVTQGEPLVTMVLM